MADIIQNMLQEALGDVARSTKFEAYLNFNTPALGPTNTEVYMHVKTASFPGKTHEAYDLKFKGRSIPIRGQTKYENTWSCTFYLTEGHELKIAFEDWVESLDQTQNMSKNLSSAVHAGQTQVLNFASELSIAQMDFSGEGQTAVYTLHNAFPKSVSSVQVDYSSVGSTLEFTVEFSYSHYTSIRVGGLKLPAKNGSGAEIPGFSEISNAGSSNFSMGGSGSNFRNEANNVLDSLKNSGLQSAGQAANSLLSGALSGDFSGVGGDLRNIATNFTSSAKGSIIGAFDSAKGQFKTSVTGAVNHLASRAISQVRRVDSVIPSRITDGTGLGSNAISNISSSIIKKFNDYV